MSTLIFDIETIGDDFDTYDELTQDVLTKGIDRGSLSEEEYEAKLNEVKGKLGLSALTGQIVAIAMLHLPSGRACVTYQAPGQTVDETDERGVRFRSMDEKEILEHFWQCAEKCNEFVTFNGRGFDVPYMMLRSAAHKMRPAKNLMANRYISSQPYSARHLDLMDQMCFYGASGKGKLHLFCRAFGIPTPKSEGVDGGHVGEMFKEGRFRDIAEYNMNDVFATGELYRHWDAYLRF